MELFEYIDILNKPYDIFYTNSVSSPLHWHYYSEILYITDGAIRIVCNDRSITLEKGDFCYIYPLQLHEVLKAQSESAEYAVIKFDIHTINIPKAYLSRMYDLFVRRTSENDYCIVLKSDMLSRSRIGELTRHIVDEYYAKDEFYALQIQADIYTVLIEAARKLPKEKKSEKRTDPDFVFYHILEFIDAHTGENLKVQELAEMCHLSYSHFAKLFRKNYGRSCKEYISYIRLNKAQELLLFTDYDISYIADETGFFDSSHFVREYKKWRGITPKQERMNRFT